MPDAIETIPKPLPCYQVWNDMLPADGGRICTGCGKLVVDFRNHKWREIERAQRESIVPLCGVYNPKQIENWGSEIKTPASGCNRMVKLSAALIAFTQIVPVNLSAQTNTPQHQVPVSDQKTKQNLPSKPKVNNPPAKRIISGTVVTQVNDTTKLPLACAELTLVRGTKMLTTETDSFGRYSLDLSNIYASLHDTFEIVVTHPRNSTHTIKFARKDLKPNQRNILDVVLADVSVVARSYSNRIFREQSYGIDPNYKPKPAEKTTQQNRAQTQEVKESKIERWWRHLWKKDRQ